MQASLPKIKGLMGIWKHYQSPAKVLHALCISHQVLFETAGNRKTYIPTLALVLSQEAAGKPLPAIPDHSD